MPNIVLRRTGALGDVLCATPIARALKTNFPNSDIIMQTGSPAAFEGNPYITKIVSVGEAVHGSTLINLDDAYENRPTMHIVDAYFDVAFTPNCHLVIPSDEKTIIFRPDLKPGPKINAIAIHAAHAWPSRTFPRSFWANLIELIQSRFDSELWLLGSGSDYNTGGQVRSFVGKTDLVETFKLIQEARVFICSDSALLHLAGATDTPIVGLFTCVKAEYRMPYRKIAMAGRDAAFATPLDCYGCLAEAPKPATMLQCRRHDNACVTSINPREIVDYLASSTLIPA